MAVAANRLIGAAADGPRVGLPADPILPLSLGTDLNGASTKSIQFDFSATDLPAARQNEFQVDFSRDLARVEQWMADRTWPAMASPALRAIVSDRFRISKSLVPAWSGRAGEMQFPTWRVAARKAAIAHELLHVFLPNGNRLLAEGLAVYLQAEIGGNPAFPNFGRPLHDLVRELAPKMVSEFRPGNPASLGAIRFTALDAVATPSPLTLKIGNDVFGEEPRGQAHIYPLAGSFVQHLIDTRGIEAFRELYALTPLVPLHQDAGVPARWADIYGLPLQSLESEWRSMIAGR